MQHPLEHNKPVIVLDLISILLITKLFRIFNHRIQKFKFELIIDGKKNYKVNLEEENIIIFFLERIKVVNKERNKIMIE